VAIFGAALWVALSLGAPPRGGRPAAPSFRLRAEAAAIAADGADGFNTLAFRMFTGLSKVHQGRVTEGLEVFEDTIAIARRNGDGFWLPRLLSQKGLVHRELLALDRARELDAEALSLARERPVTWAPEADALLNLVVDDVRVGNVERAEAALSDLERRSGETNWLTWMNELRLRTAAAEHWAARGEWSRATEMAARLLDHARRVGARGYVCSAERVRLAAAVAEDRDVEPAIRRLEEAIEGLRDFEAPLETWTSWRLLGRAYDHLGRGEPARRARTEAGREVHEIASHVEDEMLRSGFLAAPGVREVLGES